MNPDHVHAPTSTFPYPAVSKIAQYMPTYERRKETQREFRELKKKILRRKERFG